MPSNIPSKSDENGAAEFIKHQKLCDLDYYSRFSREELETKHADILHLYEILKKDARVWIALSFALIPVSVLILWDFYLLFANPAYAFYTSKNMNIAEIIILLIHIGVLLLHAAFIAFSVSDSFYLSFLGRQKETVEELLTINENQVKEALLYAFLHFQAQRNAGRTSTSPTKEQTCTAS